MIPVLEPVNQLDPSALSSHVPQQVNLDVSSVSVLGNGTNDFDGNVTLSLSVPALDNFGKGAPAHIGQYLVSIGQ